MYQILNRNKEKTAYFVLFTFLITIVLLVSVAYKNDEEIKKIETNILTHNQEFILVKQFLLNRLRSPFTNINYEIKSGESIQKILQKLKIKNNEIQLVINHFKKYGNPNQLLVGNRIDIVVKENLSKKDNSIVKFSIPITKSTTIEIIRDEEDKITSKKIITKLYKRKILAENIIIKNLYSSAIKAKINPDTIIEFARIFGFEIDFQRDIRKMIILKLFMINFLMKMENL